MVDSSPQVWGTAEGEPELVPMQCRAQARSPGVGIMPCHLIRLAAIVVHWPFMVVCTKVEKTGLNRENNSGEKLTGPIPPAGAVVWPLSTLIERLLPAPPRAASELEDCRMENVGPDSCLYLSEEVRSDGRWWVSQ